MKKIIIAPYAKKLRNGNINPKNYPWFPEVITKIKKDRHDLHINQIGIEGEKILNNIDKFTFGKSIQEIMNLVKECDIYITIDSFLGHLGAYVKKRGIIIFGKSDPNIFSYPQNRNILKDRKYLRKNQFDIWESETFDKNAFIDPKSLSAIILEELEK